MKCTSKLSLLFGILLTVFSYCNAAEQSPKYYLADNDSLRNYQVPQWYHDAKFGIWPIWGVYSVPAYRGDHAAEWYGIWMHCVKKEPETIKLSPKKRWNKYYDLLSLKTAAHHYQTYGDPSQFGYHDFMGMWKAESWNPQAWAQMAEDAGAKFMCMMGTFHDGISLYDSEHTRWDSVDMGPRRDLCAEMKTALHARGLKFGISNHFAWNSSFYKYYHNNGYAKGQDDYADLYSRGVVDEAYMKRWWDRTIEMVDKCKPDLYYFDWGWHGKPWLDGRYHEKFAAYYYNRAIEWGLGEYGNPGVVLNSKLGQMASYAVHDLERAKMSDIKSRVWQTDTSISDHSWGYSVTDEYKTPKQLIVLLADIVSKNGVLMLAFGPKADGTIPDEYRLPMLEMGKWLRANGEAIYATRPWKIAEEGPTDSNNQKASEHAGCHDMRYTRSKDGSKLYVITFGLINGKLPLRSTEVISKTKNSKVTMLANGREIPFAINDKKQLVLDLSGVTSENAGCSYAYGFRIEGFKIDGVKLTLLELSEAYMHDIANHEPLPGTYASQYPYLSGIKSVYEKAHNGVKRDTNYYGGHGNDDGNKIKIGGKEYKHGLMVCPSGKEGNGIFVIATSKLPEIKGITAEIGIDDLMTHTGSSEFIIEAYSDKKWQRLFKSRILTTRDEPVKIDVKIPSDSEFVRLITTDGGDGCNADHAVWADAKFIE